MDNLSHSVAGLLAGELLHRCLPPEADAARQGRRRSLMLTTCALAGNFPDLDLVLTPLLPAPLGYLLHHRGHTHTMLYAIPQAMLLAALIYLLWPSARRLLRESASSRTAFGLALVVGFGLHLAMDYLNSYGIHPFHPFHSGWFYGDMVFILEPVFWVAFGIPMVMMVRWAPLRWLLLLALPAALGFFAWRGFLAWQSLAALLAIGLLLAVIARRERRPMLALPVIAAAFGLAFVGIQSLASGQARVLVAKDLRAGDPKALLLDVALSPFPANPVCWNFVAVESRTDTGQYRISRGVLSLAPSALPVSACPPAFMEQALPPGRQAVAMLSQQGYSLERLRRLAAEDCYFRDWLRFARIPALELDTASDARFASSPRGNFTTLPLVEPAGRACLAGVPQWAMPRADLLAPSSSQARSNTLPGQQ
nr:metal-dependent hydrolase [uncultured Noviherbaspirillum sp.]